MKDLLISHISFEWGFIIPNIRPIHIRNYTNPPSLTPQIFLLLQMATSRALIKRLKRELDSFTANPVPFCGVEPREDDFSLWDCVMELQLPHGRKCPLAFLVHFTHEYPSKAPSVGFCTSFPYRDGASYTVRDSERVLDGKFGELISEIV